MKWKKLPHKNRDLGVILDFRYWTLTIRSSFFQHLVILELMHGSSWSLTLFRELEFGRMPGSLKNEHKEHPCMSSKMIGCWRKQLPIVAYVLNLSSISCLRKVIVSVFLIELILPNRMDNKGCGLVNNGCKSSCSMGFFHVMADTRLHDQLGWYKITWPTRLIQDYMTSPADTRLHDQLGWYKITWPARLIQDYMSSPADTRLHDQLGWYRITWPARLIQDYMTGPADTRLHDQPGWYKITWPARLIQRLHDQPSWYKITWPARLIQDYMTSSADTRLHDQPGQLYEMGLSGKKWNLISVGSTWWCWVSLDIQSLSTWFCWEKSRRKW